MNKNLLAGLGALAASVATGFVAFAVTKKKAERAHLRELVVQQGKLLSTLSETVHREKTTSFTHGAESVKKAIRELL